MTEYRSYWQQRSKGYITLLGVTVVRATAVQYIFDMYATDTTDTYLQSLPQTLPVNFTCKL